MRRVILFGVLVSAFFGILSCAHQPTGLIRIHLADNATVYDDPGALCVHRPLPERSADAYTVLILERLEEQGRLRYEINVFSEDVQCTLTGRIVDVADRPADYEVIQGNVWLTAEALPTVIKWDELVRACR
ncbi:MAG: hypothetical protein V1738_04815 [Patescibacteria group bacterium]